MANRTPISSKLKLTISYQNEEGADKTRQLTLAHLKNGAAPDAITATVDAIAALHSDPVTAITEVIENEITA